MLLAYMLSISRRAAGTLSLLAFFVPASNCMPSAYESLDASNFTLAAVRQPPVNFASPVGLNKTWVDLDLKATISQAIDTINEAKAENVALLAFPELYFPGYPVAINTNYTASQIAQYVSQSMSIDSPEFLSLLNAFKCAGMYGSFGFSEIANDAIYMAQVLIGPDGALLSHRRKLRPSGTERNIWSDGDLSGLRVTQTPHGRIGMLECWEHFHPTMTFAMLAQIENIHVAAFPYAPDVGLDPLGWEAAETGLAAARSYATNSGAIVLMPSVGTAAIFGNYGLTINMTNATANPDWKYVTTSVNTTAFKNTTYDLDGEQSWGALEQMIAEFPTYIPKTNSSYFAPQLHNISIITTEIVEQPTYTQS